MKKVFLLITFVLQGIVSCSQNEEKIIEYPKFENINPAQNNDEIITEKVWGYDDIVQSIKINSDVYAIGYATIEYNSTLRKISKSGKEIWSKTIDIVPNDILRLDDNRFAIVGEDSNDNGTIHIYDTKGNLLSSKNEHMKNFRLIFHTIVRDGVGGFLILGEKIKDNISESFLRGFTISTDNKITSSYELKIKGNNFDNYKVGSIKHLKGLDFIVSMFVDEKIMIARLTPRKVSSTTNEYKTYSKTVAPNYAINIMWQKEIVSSKFLNSQFVLNHNKIFHIVNYKKRKTSSSVEKEAGLVSCLDLNGNIQWQRKINPSNKKDWLGKAIYYNSNLFIVGEHSGYFIKDIYKSNGLLVKIDEYGEILYTKTFGNKNLKQGFTSIEVIDNKLKLLGYKGKYKKEMKNWFLEINP